MSTTPKCPICHDSGKTIHADGQQSAYLDCGCGAATARAELNQAVAAFAIINRDDLDCDWFIHQRAKALGRASALAELHPQWLAEKERADRAEARISELEAQLEEAETLISQTSHGAAERISAMEAQLAAAQAPVREVPGWISVDEQLPEKRDRSYQVIAVCKKTYAEGTNYAGQGIKGVYQDWVIRQWPGNYAYWSPLPAAPVQQEGA